MALRVLATSAQLNASAYYVRTQISPFGDLPMVYVGPSGLDELPPDAPAVSLPALMTQPYGDWEEVEPR